MTPSNLPKPKTSCNIWSKFKHWLRYRFCFCKGVLLASGLVFSDKLIEYSILALLITYLVQKENKISRIAIFAVIQEGVSALLEIFMTFISNALFGRFIIIIVSSLFYLVGLVLLYLGSQKVNDITSLDMIGILLLAVGNAGVRPLTLEFIVDQYKNHQPADQAKLDEDQVVARRDFWCRIVWSFSAIAGSLIRFFIYKWRTVFMISAVATGSSLILFLVGSIGLYHSGGFADTGSRFTIVIGELKTFLAKMKTCTRDDDKDSAPSPEEQIEKPKKRGKKYLKTGCMWTTLLLFGLILSAGKTFFPFQGENMSSSQFLAFFVVIQSISRKVASYLFGLSLSKWAPNVQQKTANLARIWLGMLLSIPCFILAWQIDPLSNWRHSIFLLLPQFCLLGFMEGLAQDGFDEFMFNLFPTSRKHYVSAINTFVIGLGNTGNIISFYAYEDGFRLEPYFKVLTIVGSVNLCYYSCISILFSKNMTETSTSSGDIKRDGRPQESQAVDLDPDIEEDEGLKTDIEGGDRDQKSRKDGSDNTGDPGCFSNLFSDCF